LCSGTQAVPGIPGIGDAAVLGPIAVEIIPSVFVPPGLARRGVVGGRGEPPGKFTRANVPHQGASPISIRGVGQGSPARLPSA